MDPKFITIGTDCVRSYSFCRVADDLIDESSSEAEAQKWVNQLRTFLDLAYRTVPPDVSNVKMQKFVESTFPPEAQLALLQLPVSYLSRKPLYGLLHGFEMDLQFAGESQSLTKLNWPISNEADLERYGGFVAGTVAELCLDLVFHHYPNCGTPEKKSYLKGAGGDMGVALQITNIARDIEVDAALRRVYIPSAWLAAEDLNQEDVIKVPRSQTVREIRSKLLDKAFGIYESSRGAIEELPREVRGPMRVAVESYMEIGRVLRQDGYQVTTGRATVPTLRRIRVAWRALRQ